MTPLKKTTSALFGRVRRARASSARARLVIPAAPVMEQGSRQMHFACIRLQTSGCIQSPPAERQAALACDRDCSSTSRNGPGEQTKRRDKSRVLGDGLIQQGDLLRQGLASRSAGPLDFFRAQVKLVGGDIGGRFRLQARPFPWVKAPRAAVARSSARSRFGSRKRPPVRDRNARPRDARSFRASINCAVTRTRLPTRCTLPSSTCATCRACAISGSLRELFSRYCITLVRLVTFRSATFASVVRISSCTPSAK